MRWVKERIDVVVDEVDGYLTSPTSEGKIFTVLCGTSLKQ